MGFSGRRDVAPLRLRLARSSVNLDADKFSVVPTKPRTVTVTEWLAPLGVLGVRETRDEARFDAPTVANNQSGIPVGD